MTENVLITRKDSTFYAKKGSQEKMEKFCFVFFFTVILVFYSVNYFLSSCMPIWPDSCAKFERNSPNGVQGAHSADVSKKQCFHMTNLWYTKKEFRDESEQETKRDEGVSIVKVNGHIAC